MNYHLLLQHRAINFLQSLALLGLLAGLLTYLAYVIVGESLAWFSGTLVLMLYLGNSLVTPWFVLRMYGASEISPQQAPELYEILEIIARRAGLPRLPRLYYVPSHVVNAFTIGSREDAAIAVSAGLLRRLAPVELAAIFSHEIAHIRHNDIRVMTFADLAGRLTKLLSLLGQAMIIISLPLVLFTRMQLPWLPLLLLLLAPLAADLIQLGLSRVREYDADRLAAELLGDARPLAAALAKIEYYQHSLLRSFSLTAHKNPEPSLLRTHPPTQQRIERLLAYQQRLPGLQGEVQTVRGQGDVWPAGFSGRQAAVPRRHFPGFWY